MQELRSTAPIYFQDIEVGNYANFVPDLANVNFLRLRGHSELEYSDGYHTMSELYHHRYVLFCALVKVYDNYKTPLSSNVICWKSKFHDDGTMFENSFIVGMTVRKLNMTTEHITYHLPLDWWDKFNIMTYEKAPPYDGHTSADVIERLMRL